MEYFILFIFLFIGGSSSRAFYIVNEPDLLSSKENRGKIRDFIYLIFYFDLFFCL